MGLQKQQKHKIEMLELYVLTHDQLIYMARGLWLCFFSFLPWQPKYLQLGELLNVHQHFIRVWE